MIFLHREYASIMTMTFLSNRGLYFGIWVDFSLSSKKKGPIRLYQTYACYMAEKRGFEPLHPFTDLLAFQASPFSHLGTSPFDEVNASRKAIHWGESPCHANGGVRGI